MAIDIIKAFQQEPPELDFVWPGFLAGTVGALVAPGATGKSFWTLQAAMAVACSVPGGDLLGLNPRFSGPVIYFAGEDPEPVLVRRLHAIGQYLSEEAREIIAESLFIEPIMGSRLDLMNDRHLQRLIEYCKGVRLIVIDTLSRFHRLDENNNSDMAQLVSVLEHIAARTGAAVLFLHHTSKSSALWGQGDKQQAARGASSLIDNARWCGYLMTITETEAQNLGLDPEEKRNYLRFGVSKQNYGALIPDCWYERRKGGVLMPITLHQINKKKYEKYEKYARDDEKSGRYGRDCATY